MGKKLPNLALALAIMMLLSLGAACAPSQQAATTQQPAASADAAATTTTEAAAPAAPATSDGAAATTAAGDAAPAATTPATDAPAGGTMKVALTNPFTGAAAINIANPYRYATFSQVYETLLAYQDGGYVGVLAKEWEKVGDYTWKVTLHDGITDSAGNPFTSSDVAFVMDSQWNVGHNLYVYYEVGSVSVIDGTTFELALNTDSVGAFYLIGSQMLMCSQAAYEGSPDNLATMPVGTGPYICTSYIEGSSCTLEKRDGYWKTGDLPKASVANPDVIEISYVPETVQMSMAIESGSAQVAGQVSMNVSKEVDALDGVTAKYISNGTYNGLGFNMKGRAVSDNKAFREAIAYAIDPNGLIAGVYSGHATPMTGYGIPTASDYDPSWISSISYDPEKAKEKLAEAGYPGGSGATVTLLSNNVGEDAIISELVQGYLAAVGITCEFDYVDPATQSARRAEGNWDLALVGGMGVLDMSLFWGNIYGLSGETGMSLYFHSDPALYAIYDKYKAAGGKTAENLQALYEYERDNVTWQPLFNKQVLYTLSDGYADIYLNDGYMALPYLGTASK
ncbi:MAG: ABC transporter substrate-binding protein [Clostridiales bacterium]|jgi:peptide/nickel transport system substrate-binding protein|nr:ABC transporter substrate-binding protein [Clostridiales bacterium]